MSFLEKRKFKRIRRSFTARIRRLADEDQSKWDIVTMRDLSASGIAFNYTNKIPLNTALEFNISVPFISDVICCSGEVCRIDDKNQTNSNTTITKPRIQVYGIAANFTQIGDVQKQSLENQAKKA